MKVLSKGWKNIICWTFVLFLLSLSCSCAVAGNEVTAEASKVIAVSEPNFVVADSAESIVGIENRSEFEKLKINPSYEYLEMEPGSEKSFSVTVENKDNKTITLSPKPIVVPYTENFIEKEWISINPSEKKLEPGEKEEFEVKVTVPEDADLGSYSVLLAFGNNTTEGDVAGLYSNYPGTMQLNLQVWPSPKVQIMTSWINDLVKAGETYDYEIMLKNNGDEDISIQPELEDGDNIRYYYNSVSSSSESSEALGNDMLSIDAPDKIKAGQTASVKLKLEVPADARGSYSWSLNLNIDDPGLRDYEDKVSLNFRILPIPEKPYETSFESLSEEPITIEITGGQSGYYMYSAGEKQDMIPSFEVSLKDPAGDKVTPILVSTKYSGTVNVIDNTDFYSPYSSFLRLPRVTDDENDSLGNYQDGTTTVVKTYKVPGAVGNWTLSIFPKNTENFGYSITIGGNESFPVAVNEQAEPTQ